MANLEVLERYRGVEQQAGAVCAIEDGHLDLAGFTPDWERCGISSANADLLRLLEFGAPAIKSKALLCGNLGILSAVCDALTVNDGKVVHWVLALFFDMLREDSSCFSVFEAAMRSKILITRPLWPLLDRPQESGSGNVADTAAWLLSAIMGQLAESFTAAEALELLARVNTSGGCSELGKLEVVTNLLKAEAFRATLWAEKSVREHIFGVDPATAQAPMLYKSVFAIWLLSFDKAILASFKDLGVVQRLECILMKNRTERVVRICLTVLKTLLDSRSLCEDIAESGLHDAVLNLEYEKWRDAELYDDIRAVANQIANEVQELSNFDRYERELHSGKLAWGFVHASKFWGENVLKFEQNDFRAVKALAALLHGCNTDAITLAVACHDIGEFVALHPLGKKTISTLQVKDRVMELMASSGDDNREVRREALLCCQKIMLNKWQDIAK